MWEAISLNPYPSHILYLMLTGLPHSRPLSPYSAHLRTRYQITRDILYPSESAKTFKAANPKSAPQSLLKLSKQQILNLLTLPCPALPCLLEKTTIKALLAHDFPALLQPPD